MLNYFHHFHILCNWFARLSERLYWKQCFRYSLVIFSTQINTEISFTWFPVDLYSTIWDLTEISVKYLCAACITVLLQLFYFTPNDCIDLPSSNSVARYWVHRGTKWAVTVIELLMLRCVCVSVNAHGPFWAICHRGNLSVWWRNEPRFKNPTIHTQPDFHISLLLHQLTSKCFCHCKLEFGRKP